MPNDILIVGIDSNSSSGVNQNNEKTSVMNSVGKFGLPHVNNAGVRFSSYLEANFLVALTTYYKKKNYVTWTHPRSKLPHQIDHMTTEKSCFRYFVDAGAIAPLIDSDHRAVFTKLRMKMNIVKRITHRQKIMRLDHSKLNDPRIKKQFCQKVNEYHSNDDTCDSYTKLENAMEKAARDILPKSNRIQPGWFSSNEKMLNALIEERNAALSMKLRKTTRSSTVRLQNARKKLKREIFRSKNNWIKGICNEINDPSRQNNVCWDKVKLLKKGLNRNPTPAAKMMT